MTGVGQPVAGVASRQHLRSAAQRLLVVPRHQLSSYGRRAFCVAGPSVWNFLPDNLRNPIIGGNSFRQSLKTFLFARYWCIQRIRGFTSMRYINRLFTYLLTYLLTGHWQTGPAARRASSSLRGRQLLNCLALRPPIGPNALPLINQLVIEIS